MKTIAICNLKGGVGKTTTALNLGAVLAANARVLLIDADSQYNLSLHLRADCTGATLASLFEGESYYDNLIQPTYLRQVDIIPASFDLMAYDLSMLTGGRANRYALRDLCTALAEDEAYDYVLIDCPPSFSAACAAALAAADEVILPTTVGAYEQEGARNLLRQIGGMRQINPELHVAGVLITRYYQEVMIVEGRKNGKTTECAALEIDLLVNDNEGAPEIYSIATKREQAAKSYTACVNMRKQSPELFRAIRKRQGDLYYPANLGTLSALASAANSLDGLNAHGVLVDELAAIKNRAIYDDMKQSMSAREQPLLFSISTNGFVRECIFDAQYAYAAGVLEGTIIDDHFLPWIYELDEREEYKNEKCWVKANPGLGTIKKVEYLRQMVKKASADPSFLPTVLVKDFNVKENAATAWLTWAECSNPATFDIAFDYCIGGMDAADSIDLCAATAICQRPGDPKIYRRSMYWLPQSVLDTDAASGNRRERDSAPYSLWVKRGLMRAVPGNKVDKQVLLDWFIELRDEDDLYVRYIGYDPWHIDDSLLDRFKAEFGAGCMIPVRQGTLSLSQPMKDLKADLAAGLVVDNNNPVDKWCLVNTEVRTDINGNIQPVKMSDGRRRIDGTVALICAYKVLQDKRDDYVNMNEEA